MKKVLSGILILIFCVSCSTATLDKPEINFGYYYTWSENELIREFGRKENFRQKLLSATARMEELIGAKIKISFIEKLPFTPPRVTIEESRGIDAMYLFKVFRYEKIGLRNQDAIFILTPEIIWNTEDIDPSYRGIVEYSTSSITIIRYYHKSGFGEGFVHDSLHEFGHKFGFDHASPAQCIKYYFIMCGFESYNKEIKIEEKYQKAINNFWSKQ